MPEKVKPIPDGYHTFTPYLIIKGAANAIDFYKKAFGATELFRIPGSNGRIGHAEIKIGDSPIMLADEHPEIGALSPDTVGGCPVHLMLYVEDVDTTFNQAVAAGGQVKDPLTNKFYGDRMGAIRDPFGFLWYLATHIEDVSPEDMQARAAAEQHG
jgi:PhnB protein